MKKELSISVVSPVYQAEKIIQELILRLEKVIATFEEKKNSSSAISGVVHVNNNPTTLLKKAHNVIDEAIQVLEIEKRKD